MKPPPLSMADINSQVFFGAASHGDLYFQQFFSWICYPPIIQTIERFQDLKPQQYMGVSENSGFSPQIIHFNRVFHYKPSILGYHYFWKHPYITKEQKKPHKEFFFADMNQFAFSTSAKFIRFLLASFFQEAMLAILPGHGFHSVKLGNTSAIVQRWAMEKRLRADRLRG